MARFTDPDKWKDSWFRKLTPPQKLVWLYLVDTCDNAGFFEYDPEMMAFFIGMTPDKVEGAFEGLKRGLSGPKGGDVYHISNFLKYQRNIPLNRSNNAHRQIIRILEEKRDLFNSVADAFLGPSEGLISPPVVYSKGKGNSKGTGKGNVGGKVDYPEKFEAFWREYKVGGKKPAYDAWLKQKPSDEEIIVIMKAIPEYKAYCTAVERSFKDGQGWVNQRFWETDWTQQPRSGSGPKPAMDTSIY